MQDENYLDVLELSLKKKCQILERIQVKNEQQRVMLLDDDLAVEDFEKNVEEKAELVEQLDLLDEGFEETYRRVRDFVEQNRTLYKQQIERLQDMIRQIMAASSSIQAEEQRNYKLAQKKFSKVKKQIRSIKASQRAVTTYYQNMTKRNYVDAQFMDNKK